MAEEINFRINDDVMIKGYEEDCGKGVVEGRVTFKEGYRVAVRFNHHLFTKNGIQYMKGNPALNPNGPRSIIFCIPYTDLISVGSFKHQEVKDGNRRTKRKA